MNLSTSGHGTQGPERLSLPSRVLRATRRTLVQRKKVESNAQARKALEKMIKKAQESYKAEEEAAKAIESIVHHVFHINVGIEGNRSGSRTRVKRWNVMDGACIQKGGRISTCVKQLPHGVSDPCRPFYP